MTSTPNFTAISVSAERRRIRGLPSGSNLRRIGALWLAWLAHVRRCQTEGLEVASATCVEHHGSAFALDDAYPNWDCCDVHKALKEERERLVAHAQAMNMHTAPHQTDDVLSPEWWLLSGYRYSIHRRVLA